MTGTPKWFISSLIAARKCATYHWAVRSACYSLAWTYYTAVRNFGSLVVTKADLQRAQALMQDA